MEKINSGANQSSNQNMDGQNSFIGRFPLFGNFAFLPLFHKPVEERVGERRILFRWEVRP
jgi:hypothetical protein